MTILVTGAAGFIGYHVAEALLARGETVIGIDNFNAYYDPALKEARAAQLARRKDFVLRRIDIADQDAMAALAVEFPDITGIVHLAAQAGVRYSLTSPRSYIRSNLVGQLEILELARGLKRLDHLVYASSSSVYGGTDQMPFALDDRCDRPQNLYAATKRADELMGYAYAGLYGIKMTGLRFFTVYGPWGRPDMAVYLFTQAILAGKTIRLFNNGEMERDFTYVADIVAGVIAALDRPPGDASPEGAPPHRLYNLGNHTSEPLGRLVAILEQACGRPAVIEMAPMQPGEMLRTYADIAESQRDLGFAPVTPIDQGLPAFVAWYRDYHRL